MAGLITIGDVRKSGHCVAGARRWFESYDFDFRAFIENGLPEAELAATGDALALQVIADKNAREAANG